MTPGRMGRDVAERPCAGRPVARGAEGRVDAEDGVDAGGGVDAGAAAAGAPRPRRPAGPSLLLAKAHYPVTTLGPGVRAGLWTQGCTIGCAGCLSRDTWDPDSRAAVPVSAVLGWLASLPGPVDGVTISGGEPFQQPEALAALLRGIHEWRAAGARPGTSTAPAAAARGAPPGSARAAERAGAVPDVLVYSGYAFSRLARSPRTREILALCDAVVTGPYVARRGDGGPLRGSANQRVVPLTDLGHRRYDDLDAATAGRPRIQVSVDTGSAGRRIYYIGIPRRGDMDRLNSTLERAGVHPGEVSWRP
jgi:anaerobic ribonucleoside-triphosphate reductase activating protein